MIVVVDASAISAILFGEPDGATIQAHLRDDQMMAPHLIDFELANVSVKRIRRTPAAAGAILAMLAGLQALPIRRVAVPPLEAAKLAARTGLTAYDASYLWLAMTHDSELVTLDNRLAKVNLELRDLS
jgi:predicted nucleic acid-binding protein